MASAHNAFGNGAGAGKTLLGLLIDATSKLTFASYKEYPHEVPDGSIVQNYAYCSLCTNPYLLDASGSDVCSRKMCKAVVVIWQQEAEAHQV